MTTTDLRQIKRIGLVSVLSVYLAACGGGSSGGSGPPPPVQQPDRTPPVVSIMGDDPLLVEVGAEFDDPGASATDDTDGNVQVTVEGSVDTNMVGDHTLTYVAVDAAGNRGETTRLVQVADRTPPVITLSGDDTLFVEAGGGFIDPGASAIDAYDGAVEISVEGSVDVNEEGDYTLTYIAVDGAGNRAEVTRVVTVTPEMHQITISFFGDGRIDTDSGTVLSCAMRKCTAEIEEGSSLTLVANPNPGWSFSNWRGCDAVTSDACTVTVTEDTLIDAAFFSNTPLQVKNQVVELTEAQIRQIDRYNPNSGTIVFDVGTDTSAFEPGRILLSSGVSDTSGDGIPTYFARRVKQVFANPGSVALVDTRDATLEDIFEEGTLSLQEPLNAGDVDQASLPQGITLLVASGLQAQPSGTVLASASYGGANLTAPIPLEEEIIPFSLDVMISDGFRVSGTINLSIDPQIDMDFGVLDGLREFRSVFRVSSRSSIAVHLDREISLKDRIPIGGPIQFGVIFAGPIAFLPRVQLYLVYDVGVDGSYSPQFSVSAAFEGGAHYLKDMGWRTISERSSSADANLGLEQVSARIKGEAGPEIDLGLLLMGVIGPSVSAASYGGFEAFPVSEPTEICAWDYNAYLTFAGRFVGNFEILSKRLSYQAQLFRLKSIIAQGEGECEGELVSPSSVTATSHPPQQVMVEWSYDGDSSGVSYAVYRDNREIASHLIDLQYLDSRVEPNTRYCYFVVARSVDGETSEPSNTACLITPEEDDDPPRQPLGLEGEVLSSSAVSLNWIELDDDVFYVVYGGRSNGDLYAMAQAANNAANITGLLPETEYCFEVSAVDGAGQESQASDGVCLTTNSQDSAEWTITIGCQNRAWLLAEKLDLDERFSTSVSVVGTGNDYNGTRLTYALSGIFDVDAEKLTGEITWTFEGSSESRLDRFVASLRGGDSGVVFMDQIQRTGCDAQIRFFKGENSEAGSSPAALGSSGLINQL